MQSMKILKLALHHNLFYKHKFIGTEDVKLFFPWSFGFVNNWSSINTTRLIVKL